jgi:pentatricopeptide repeat protein
MSTTDIDYDELAELAQRAAGNWMAWRNFGWWGKPPDAERWAIFVISNRDSGLLELSNANVIAKALTRFDQGEYPTVMFQDHNHWALGYVRNACIRVFTKKGRVTKAFKVWCDLQDRLENYPILDETDYSNREYDAALSNIREQGRRHVVDGAPEYWPSLVYEWLSNNGHDRELENRDDQGAYPDEDVVKEALAVLSLLIPEDETCSEN